MELLKPGVRFYMHKYMKGAEDEDFISLENIEEILKDDKRLLVYLVQLFTEKEMLNEAKGIVERH